VLPSAARLMGQATLWAASLWALPLAAGVLRLWSEAPLAAVPASAAGPVSSGPATRGRAGVRTPAMAGRYPRTTPLVASLR
jgi:hypothetical protein